MDYIIGVDIGGTYIKCYIVKHCRRSTSADILT